MSQPKTSNELYVSLLSKWAPVVSVAASATDMDPMETALAFSDELKSLVIRVRQEMYLESLETLKITMGSKEVYRG